MGARCTWPSAKIRTACCAGLYMTSWLVEDFLHNRQQFGAAACLITSASSKTSIALAHAVRERGALPAIGITSARNVAFCQGLGCYDEIITYDDISTLDGTTAVVLVDMAGSTTVLSALHRHFGEQMKYSCRIGATHHDDTTPLPELPGAKPQFFFAPTHVKERSAEIGAGALMQAMGSAYAGFRGFADGWLEIRQHKGFEALEAAYQTVLNGRSDPAHGHIVSLWT